MAKKQPKENRLLNIHASFRENLDALDVFLSNLLPVAKKHDKTVLENNTILAKKIIKMLKRAKKIKLLKTNPINLEEKIALNLRPPATNLDILLKSSFVILISYLEYLFLDLIHVYYRKFPNALSGKDVCISLKELKSSSDIAEAVDFLIHKEADKVLYDSFQEQMRYFEQTLKVAIPKDNMDFNIINEAIQRRNIIVHNNSIVNRRYLANVDAMFLATESLKEGNRIEVKSEYFTSIFYDIFLLGNIIMQQSWRKWDKDDLYAADDALIDEIYKLLAREKWSIAEILCCFSKKLECANQAHRLMFDVNYCISLKWQKKHSLLAKELQALENSSLSPMFVLALDALRSDRSSFYQHIENAILVDKLGKFAFFDWPLFREFRKDPEYSAKINRALLKINRKK